MKYNIDVGPSYICLHNIHVCEVLFVEHRYKHGHDMTLRSYIRKKNDISFTESVRYFNHLLKRTELHKNNKNAYMANRSIALFVFNLNIRCRLVLNFTPRPLFRRLKTFAMGSTAGVGDLGTRNISCLCPYLKPGSSNQ